MKTYTQPDFFRVSSGEHYMRDMSNELAFRLAVRFLHGFCLPKFIHRAHSFETTHKLNIMVDCVESIWLQLQHGGSYAATAADGSMQVPMGSMFAIVIYFFWAQIITSYIYIYSSLVNMLTLNCFGWR